MDKPCQKPCQWQSDYNIILLFFLQCPTIEQILWSSHSKTFEHREIMEDEAPVIMLATHELVRFNIHQKPYSYFMLFHVTHSYVHQLSYHQLYISLLLPFFR